VAHFIVQLLERVNVIFVSFFL